MRSAMLFNFLVEATLIGSGLIGLMLLVRACRSRLGSRMVWAVWLLVALRLLTPLALPNPVMNDVKPIFSQDTGIRPMAEQVRMHLTDAAQAAALETVAGGTLADVARDGRLGQVALPVYLAGVVGCGLWMLCANARWRRQMRRVQVGELTEGERAAYGELCLARQIRRAPRVRKTTLSAACVAGVLRPVILVPQGMNEADFRRVVGRELCHYQNGDQLWLLVRSLCCLVHWFNPLVWMAAHLARLDCELACDERAVAGMDTDARRACAEVLLRGDANSRTTPGLGVAATCLIIKQQRCRREQLLRGMPVRRGALAALCLACALVVSFMFATAELHAEAEPSAMLTEQPDAEDFARNFLCSSGMDADAFRGRPLVTRTLTGWHVEQYLKGETLPCVLDFAADGAVSDYRCLAAGQDAGGGAPIGNAEGATWCAYLRAFLRRNQPELAGRCASFTPVYTSADAEGRYLTIRLMDHNHAAMGTAVYQLSPCQRLVALTFEPAG